MTLPPENDPMTHDARRLQDSMDDPLKVFKDASSWKKIGTPLPIAISPVFVDTTVVLREYRFDTERYRRYLGIVIVMVIPFAVAIISAILIRQSLIFDRKTNDFLDNFLTVSAVIAPLITIIVGWFLVHMKRFKVSVHSDGVTVRTAFHTHTFENSPNTVLIDKSVVANAVTIDIYIASLLRKGMRSMIWMVGPGAVDDIRMSLSKATMITERNKQTAQLISWFVRYPQFVTSVIIFYVFFCCFTFIR